MMRGTLLVGVLLGVALSAGVARGAEESDFLRKRGYIGGGVGGSFNVQDFDEAGNAVGLDFRGGYRFHQHIAVEGQINYFNNVGGSFQGGDIDLNTFSFTTNLKKFFPIDRAGRWQPYLLAGIGVTRAAADIEFAGQTVTDRTESAFTFRSGAGLEFYITPHVNLYTEATYMLLTGGLHGAAFVPLVFGAQYQF